MLLYAQFVLSQCFFLLCSSGLDFYVAFVCYIALHRETRARSVSKDSTRRQANYKSDRSQRGISSKSRDKVENTGRSRYCR